MMDLPPLRALDGRCSGATVETVDVGQRQRPVVEDAGGRRRGRHVPPELGEARPDAGPHGNARQRAERGQECGGREGEAPGNRENGTTDRGREATHHDGSPVDEGSMTDWVTTQRSRRGVLRATSPEKSEPTPR